MITYIKIDATEDGHHPLRTTDRPQRPGDWIEVPRYLVPPVRACGGHCELFIKDGLLVGIYPEIPVGNRS